MDYYRAEGASRRKVDRIAPGACPGGRRALRRFASGSRGSARLCAWPLLMLLVAASSGADVVADARQLQLLANNCLQCHTSQETGAPRLGNRSDWAAARAGGEDAMLINLVQGIRGMPPLGYCSACSEDDFRVLIRLLMGDPANENDPDPLP